ARQCRDWLSGMGWPAPVLADSGNGAHLNYRIELPNDAASVRLIQRCLQALELYFGDDVVVVDQSTFNAARIWKLYGTVARKGDNTPERPHRLSQLLDVPEALVQVPVDCLEALAALAPEEPPAAKSPPNNGHASPFDLERWITEHGLPVHRHGPWGNG